MNARRLLEVVATVVLLAGSLWLGQLVHHNRWGHASATTVEPPGEILARTADGTPEVVPLRALGDSLVFVLSADCRFCQETAPRWREIVAGLDPGLRDDVRVFSLSDGDDTAAFLAEHGLEKADVVHIDRSELAVLGLRGVPATLALSADATMRRWTGVLDDDDHEAILAWAGSPVR